MKTNNIGNTTDVKEEFCSACALVPLALAGATSTAYGSQTNGQYKNIAKITFWGGIITVIISTILAYYFIMIKQCKDCQL